LPTRTLAATAIAALLLAVHMPVFAADTASPAAAGAAAQPAAATAPEPEPRASRTRHKVRIGGEVVQYTATAGWLIMKNDEGKPIARFGYTAYTRDGIEDLSRRPRSGCTWASSGRGGWW
jgi:carboxypeptidase C (cathepsin A)